MNISVPMLVSAHAIEQFQQRIAALSETKARQFILTGIRQAVNVRLLPDGGTLRVRTRRPFPFEFRAYCVYDPAQLCYVVTTVVRGDSHVRRKQKQKAERDGCDGGRTAPGRSSSV
jgi:hypothetical protein